MFTDNPSPGPERCANCGRVSPRGVDGRRSAGLLRTRTDADLWSESANWRRLTNFRIRTSLTRAVVREGARVEADLGMFSMFAKQGPHRRKETPQAKKCWTAVWYFSARGAFVAVWKLWKIVLLSKNFVQNAKCKMTKKLNTHIFLSKNCNFWPHLLFNLRRCWF